MEGGGTRGDGQAFVKSQDVTSLFDFRFDLAAAALVAVSARGGKPVLVVTHAPGLDRAPCDTMLAALLVTEFEAGIFGFGTEFGEGL